jgi:EAL domain-containing protein (putative c-di-GMP-specific phosphodiesterase class I)
MTPPPTLFDRGEIRALFQPKVALASGALVGARAICFDSPRGLTGAVASLATEIFTQAVQACLDWSLAGIRVPVTVSMPADSLEDDAALVARWARIAAQHGVDPGEIMIELSEFVPTSAALDTIARLRGSGFRLARAFRDPQPGHLTGAVSYPCDEIVIGAHFLYAALDDPREVAALRTMVETARALKLRAVAEGVNGAMHLAVLERVKCEAGQGSCFAVPMKAAQLLAWARERGHEGGARRTYAGRHSPIGSFR